MKGGEGKLTLQVIDDDEHSSAKISVANLKTHEVKTHGIVPLVTF